ncbi:MAG: DUF177 domain-containing protein [Nitrospinae bacterium]|nr:DUF177 domain-containing protein [Nitrospinota bacterium]
MTEKKPAVQVDVDTISPEEGLTLDLRRPFDFFFSEEDGVVGASDVGINVSLSKVGNEVFAVGTVGGAVRLQCGRCLKEFDYELEAEVNAPFLPKGGGDREPSPASEAEGPEEDEGDVNYYKGKTLDLYNVLRDQLFLALPLKPLCREECKGLCPSCGADLNKGPCSCGPKKGDPRLAALKKLKDKL